MERSFGSGKLASELGIGDEYAVPRSNVSNITKDAPTIYRRRFVSKDGYCKVNHQRSVRSGLSSTSFWIDFFNTVVDIKWRWSIVLFSSVILFMWTFYGICYFIISFAHGDVTARTDYPCIHNVDSFAASFLFSLETQSTIGYGARYVNAECPMAVVTVVIQTITGAMLQTLLLGIMFTKLARATHRARRFQFSKNACIWKKYDKMVFSFRLGDREKLPIIDCGIKLLMIKDSKYGAQQECLFLGEDSIDRKILLVYPLIINHVIDERSPLYEITKEQFYNLSCEFVVLLEGVMRSTGNSTQAMTSYLPQEVKWGWRFRSDLIKPDPLSDGFIYNDDYFNEMVRDTED